MRSWAPYILFLVIAVTASGCDVHEFPCEPVSAETEVEIELTFNSGDMDWLTTVEYDVDSRGESQGYDFRYQVFVYDNASGKSRTPVQKFVFTSPESSRSHSRSVTLSLDPGQYTARVWADYVPQETDDDKFYDTSDLTAITVKTDSNGDIYGNELHRSAYVGEAEFTVPEMAKGLIIVPCSMLRPLARYEFVTTDLRKFLGENFSQADEILDKYSIRVRYTGYMPCKYNFYTERPVDSWLGMGYDARIEPIDGQSARLGFDYVLVGDTETSVDVALDVYDAKGDLIASTESITVPLLRDHYTLIRGDFLTAVANGGVGIDPNFNGDYNIEIR